jgi:RNA polymerase sigma-70 factor (ECF subfamily)
MTARVTDDTGEVAARVFRDERAAVLATLIRHVGDFQLAEEAMADAFEAALATWPRDGVPRNPGAWRRRPRCPPPSRTRRPR